MSTLSPAEKRRSMRISTLEGCFAGAHLALTSGVFLVGFVTALGGSYIHFGLICAIPTLTGVAASVGPLITGKVVDIAKGQGFGLECIIILFCLVAAARFGAQYLVRDIKEPTATSVRHMIGTIGYKLRGIIPASKVPYAAQDDDKVL